MSGVFTRESYRTFKYGYAEATMQLVEELGGSEHWTSAVDAQGARHFTCCEAWEGWTLTIWGAASGLCPENLDDLLRRMA